MFLALRTAGFAVAGSDFGICPVTHHNLIASLSGTTRFPVPMRLQEEKLGTKVAAGHGSQPTLKLGRTDLRLIQTRQVSINRVGPRDRPEMDPFRFYPLPKRLCKQVKTLLKHYKMQNLCFLPSELVDLVCFFAYNISHKSVLHSVNQMCRILDMRMPFFFFRRAIWSWHYSKFLPSPLVEFLPIEYYGNYAQLFDEDVLFYFLLCLDFRRRKVRVFGTRGRWIDLFLASWHTYEPFGAYYKMLLRSKTPVLKNNSPFQNLVGGGGGT